MATVAPRGYDFASSHNNPINEPERGTGESMHSPDLPCKRVHGMEPQGVPERPSARRNSWEWLDAP
jgi:hypothetical protein